MNRYYVLKGRKKGENMKEEERLKRISNVEVMKEEMKVLKAKRTELNNLKSNQFVKRFLELSEELEDKKILTLEEIKKEEFNKYTCYSECSHDIWCYMGAYYTEYDRGPESEDRSYRAFREEDIEYYRYRCLECFEEVEVKKKDHEEFIKQHTILRTTNNSFFYDGNYRKVREMYFKILYTNNTEDAYKKLIRRI